MKKTVKILALIMALMMAFVCFTACDEKVKDGKESGEQAAEEAKNEDEKKALEDVEKVVEDYVAALIDLDFDSAKDSLDKDCDAYETIEEVEEGTGIDPVDELAENIRKEYFAEGEYEIVSSEVDGDKATVAVSSNLDLKNIELEGNEKILDRANEISVEEDVEDGYDLDDWYNYAVETGHADEYYEDIYVPYMEQAWDEVKDEIFDDLDEDEFEFVLEKDGDDWIIVDIK